MVSHRVSIHQIQLRVSFIVSILGVEVIGGTLGGRRRESGGGETFGGGGGGGGGGSGARGTRVYNVGSGCALLPGVLLRQLGEEPDAFSYIEVVIIGVLWAGVLVFAVIAHRLGITGITNHRWRKTGIRVACAAVSWCRPRVLSLAIRARWRWGPLTKATADDPVDRRQREVKEAEADRHI